MGSKPKIRSLVTAGGVVLLGLMATGCSSMTGLKEEWGKKVESISWKGPQPWEKGNLAKPEMTMGGDGLDNRYVQHTFGSKEGSSGGYGVGGGGCGCN